MLDISTDGSRQKIYVYITYSTLNTLHSCCSGSGGSGCCGGGSGSGCGRGETKTIAMKARFQFSCIAHTGQPSPTGHWLDPKKIMNILLFSLWLDPSYDL